MVLEIGIFFVRLTFDKSACLKMIGSTGPLSPEKPVKPDFGSTPGTEIWIFTDRFFTFPLYIYLQMILKVFPYSRQVMHDINPVSLKFFCISYSGELKNLWRIDGTATEDHFPPGGHAPYFSSFFKFYSDRLFPFEEYFMNHGPGQYCQIGSVFDRMEVGSCSASPSRAIDRLIKFSESFLLGTVDIISQGIPCFLY